MKVQGVWETDIGDSELKADDVLECGRGVDVEVLCAAQQTHRRQQTYKPEIMIAMEMRDKDVVDPGTPDLVFSHLHLGTFTAIDKEDVVFHGDYLCRRVAIKGRQGGIIA
jgi:hypothetical protein